MFPMRKRSFDSASWSRPPTPAAHDVRRCRLTDLDQREIDAAALLCEVLQRRGEPVTMAECLALVREGADW